MDAQWIECGFILRGQPIGVAVRRLGSEERQRVAAEIAWFADALLAAQPQSAAWGPVLDRILSQDVAITLDEDCLNADGAWDRLVCRTFEAFVAANELDASIRCYLRTGSRSA